MDQTPYDTPIHFENDIPDPVSGDVFHIQIRDNFHKRDQVKVVAYIGSDYIDQAIEIQSADWLREIAKGLNEAADKLDQLQSKGAA